MAIISNSHDFIGTTSVAIIISELDYEEARKFTIFYDVLGHTDYGPVCSFAEKLLQ